MRKNGSTDKPDRGRDLVMVEIKPMSYSQKVVCLTTKTGTKRKLIHFGMMKFLHFIGHHRKVLNRMQYTI